MAILKSSKSGTSYDTETGIRTNIDGTTTQVNNGTITPEILKGSTSKLEIPDTSTTYNQNLSGAINGVIANNKIDQTDYAKTQSQTDDIYSKLMGVNTEEANVNQTVDRTAENEARKQADKYTSQIEQLQKSTRDNIESLRKNNPQGMSAGALNATINDIERESLSKQADLALLQSASIRDYSTLNSIAEQQVQNNLAQIKAKKENLQLFISKLDKTEQRQYDAIQKQVDREYKEQEELQNDIKAIKLEAVKNGAGPSVINALSNSKTLDEALKNAGSYLATSKNDIVKLDNGNTVVIDKRTGKVINNIGGGKSPSVVTQTVNGTPVIGYTMVAGDDPYFIAQQYGITTDELKKLNPKITNWNNIPVGATLNVPQNQEDAFVQTLKATDGGKALTDTTIQKLDKGLTVLNQLGVLQSNVDGVKTGPIVGAFKSANPWDTQGQTIKAQLNAIVPNLARGVYGEVGVLTDNDIKTYSNTIPNLKSTEEVRNAVLYITLDMIGKSIKNTLNVNASAGRDVSGFTDIYTEMQNTKNSILQQIPNAQIPKAFDTTNNDDFLNQFLSSSVNSSISNSDFFNNL